MLLLLTNSVAAPITDSGPDAGASFGGGTEVVQAVGAGSWYAPKRQHFGPRREWLGEIGKASIVEDDAEDEAGKLLAVTEQSADEPDPQINRINSLFADRYPQFDYSENKELLDSLRLEMQQQDDEDQAIALALAMML